jgi:hypothetical protein
VLKHAVTLRERSEPGPNGPKQSKPRVWGPRGIEREQGAARALTLRERSEPGPNGPKQSKPRGWGPRGIEQ